jgi:probable F420-dependent oxidoreductase
MMQIGCDLPYFESPAEIRAFAQGVEALGFAHLGYSEHVAGSEATEYPPGFAFSEPWHETVSLSGFLAGVTTRIELNPSVMLITLRHPVLVAKQMAELQSLSEGRLRPVASVGWNREEQWALGVDPATRGERIDEAIPLIRRLLSEPSVSQTGRHFVIDRVGIHPRPSPPPPIWLGGGGLETGGVPTERALRRAGTLADGFKLMAPTGLDVDNVLRLAEQLHRHAAEAGRTIGVEARLLTQVTPKEEWSTVVRRYRESGLISHMGLGNRIVGGSLDDQLGLLGDVIERTRDEWS